jgi:hypothetical protein
MAVHTGKQAWDKEMVMGFSWIKIKTRRDKHHRRSKYFDR